jgi:hypothetical protein
MVAAAVMSAHPERGSVFIYLMVACFLFGMLMFAYSRTSGTSSNVLSESETRLAAQEIKSYANSVRNTVNRLMNNGCGDADLRFYHPNFYGAANYAGQAGYGVSPGNECYAFDPSNTVSTPWRRPPKAVIDFGISDYVFTGLNQIEDLGRNGCSGSPDPSYELTMKLIVPKELCIHYNKINGVTNPGGSPPEAQYSSVYDNSFKPNNYTQFGWGGIFYGCGTMIGQGTPNAQIYTRGKHAGCIKVTSNGDVRYELWEVLLVR